uniref:Uncharacterized protein n=1 Tax=Vannella robusta TaxID=1487602 RepID=A0A7S4IH88_9EUKA|mmetsp:Transcript_25817/g.32945  ORF Transcript_25817/g.32945 Transcript_25817/m.32945 type:complete len:204 (+) Transcript_25817:20-631(+)
MPSIIHSDSNLLELCLRLNAPSAGTMSLVRPLAGQVNDVGPNGGSALHYVALGHNLKLASWLLAHGAKFRVNEFNETPLHWACRGGCTGIVDMFLKHMSPDQIAMKNYQGFTALDLSKSDYRLKDIHKLIKHKTSHNHHHVPSIPHVPSVPHVTHSSHAPQLQTRVPSVRKMVRSNTKRHLRRHFASSRRFMDSEPFNKHLAA